MNIYVHRQMLSGRFKRYKKKKVRRIEVSGQRRVGVGKTIKEE